MLYELKGIGAVKENARTKKGREEGLFLRWTGGSTGKQSVKVTGRQPASLAQALGRDLVAQRSILTRARFLGVKDL